MAGFLSVVSVFGGAVVVSGVISFSSLWVNAVQRARERDCLAQVLQPAEPGHNPLDSHAKPAVRHSTVLAQIQIPLEGRFRQSMFTNAFQQEVVITDALRAANNFA